jgi:hypothetical protein
MPRPPVEHLGPLGLGELHRVRGALENAVEEGRLEVDAGQDLLLDAVFGDEIDDVDAPAFLADAKECIFLILFISHIHCCPRTIREIQFTSQAVLIIPVSAPH